MTPHERRVEAIYARSNGVQPLRQVSAIPEGYQKNRSQIWRLTVNKATILHRVGLIRFDHRPGYGVFGAGSVRTKSFVVPTDLGRRYVDLCREAARQSNLFWPEHPYGNIDQHDTTYESFQAAWLDRREAFQRALLRLDPGEKP